MLQLCISLRPREKDEDLCSSKIVLLPGKISTCLKQHLTPVNPQIKPLSLKTPTRLKWFDNLFIFLYNYITYIFHIIVYHGNILVKWNVEVFYHFVIFVLEMLMFILLSKHVVYICL